MFKEEEVTREIERQNTSSEVAPLSKVLQKDSIMSPAGRGKWMKNLQGNSVSGTEKPTILLASDTIAAISTPLGEGGIGIVRISGDQALTIAGRIFKSKVASTSLLTEKGCATFDIQDIEIKNFPSHTIHYGQIINPENLERIDTVLLSVMRSPKSYTKEDVVEINGHGGIVPLCKILELVLLFGARLAQPGEFTKRAFLNGRIDLSQAEAVLDVIRAKTDLAMKFSLSQLEGKLCQKILNLKTQIISLLANIETYLDFAEDEDIDTLHQQEMLKIAVDIQSEITMLLDSAKTGQILKNGATTVIIGKPNVGKSSLLNSLLGLPRAIVTPIPGTTRDTLEEMIDVKGIPLKIIDTAGLRHTVDIVEKEGVQRAKQALELADLILLVLDGSNELTYDDKVIMAELASRETIVVLNKSDCPNIIQQEQITQIMPDKKIVHTSTVLDKGIDELKDTIKEIFFSGNIITTEGLLITNLRHKEAIKKAEQSMTQAIESFKNEMPLEFISMDLRETLDNLGGIVGETVTEDILDEIFSKFCIGK